MPAASRPPPPGDGAYLSVAADPIRRPSSMAGRCGALTAPGQSVHGWVTLLPGRLTVTETPGARTAGLPRRPDSAGTTLS